MKIVLFIVSLIFLISCSSKRSAIKNSSNVTNTDMDKDGFNVYEYLDILPHAFKVSHSSEIVNDYTEHSTDWPYKWHFRTSVKNVSKKELTIVSFGMLAWDNGRWVIDKKQENYNSGILSFQAFSDWYNCSEGIIKPGETFSDSTNWAGSYNTKPFSQKWFYLARDKKGDFYIGESDVRFEKPKFK